MTDAAVSKLPVWRRVLGNSAALTLGRGGVALMRLAIAALVVRSAGPETFAAYLLLLSLLSVAEWLTDFGSTEIAVRELCRDFGKQSAWLRTVAIARLLQAPLAALALVALLWALRYPPAMVQAGAVAALSLFFTAASGVYRVVFKATLSMAHEMLAEVLSVALMVPLLWWALQRGGDLSLLMACHVVSRALFFALCYALCRRRAEFSWRGGSPGEITSLLRTALPIGCIGLLVAVYEALDVLMLSKLGQPVELAYLSAAQRIVWPVLMVLSAISGSLYPIMATLWPAAPARFAASCQAALEAVLTLAGLAAAVAFAGAEFLLGLLGLALVQGAPVMRVMAVLLFVKAVASSLGAFAVCRARAARRLGHDRLRSAGQGSGHCHDGRALWLHRRGADLGDGRTGLRRRAHSVAAQPPFVVALAMGHAAAHCWCGRRHRHAGALAG